MKNKIKVNTMKKSTVLFFLTLMALLLIAVTINAKPNIDGIIADNDPDWSGHSSSFDGYAAGGRKFEINRIGVYVSNNVLFFGLRSGFELNHRERGLAPGDISLSFTQGAKQVDFGIRYNVQGAQNRDWARINHEYSVNLNIYNASRWHTKREWQVDASGNSYRSADTSNYRVASGTNPSDGFPGPLELTGAGAYQRVGAATPNYSGSNINTRWNNGPNPPSNFGQPTKFGLFAFFSGHHQGVRCKTQGVQL